MNLKYLYTLKAPSFFFLVVPNLRFGVETRLPIKAIIQDNQQYGSTIYSNKQEYKENFLFFHLDFTFI